MSAKYKLLLFFLGIPSLVLLVQFFYTRHYVKSEVQPFVLHDVLNHTQRIARHISLERKFVRAMNSAEVFSSPAGHDKFLRDLIQQNPGDLPLPIYLNNKVYYLDSNTNKDPILFPSSLNSADLGRSNLAFILNAKSLSPDTPSSGEITEIAQKNPFPSSLIRHIDGREMLVGFDKIPNSDVFIVATQNANLSSQFVNLFSYNSLILILALLALSLGAGYYLVQDFIAPINHIVSAMDQVGKGNYDFSIDYESSDELGRLTKRFNSMLSSVRSYIWNQRELTRMKSELETAKTIQKFFNIAANVKYPGVSIAGTIVTATECGGDFWSHFENQGRYFVIVGDATGHGTPAALMTSAASVAINSLKSVRIKDCEDLLQRLNQIIFDTVKGNIYFTAACAMIDFTEKTIEFGVAGHSPIICYNSFNTATTWDQFELYGDSSSHVGRTEEARFFTAKTPLLPNMRMMIYSDGYFEVSDKNGRKISDRQLIRNFHSSLQNAQTPEDVLNIQKNLLEGLLLGNSPKDDITLVTIFTDSEI